MLHRFADRLYRADRWDNLLAEGWDQIHRFSVTETQIIRGELT